MNHFKHTIALLGCALAASAANAATVQITFDKNIFNGSGSDNVWVTFANQGSTSGTTTEHVAAGRFQGAASDLVGVAPSIFFSDVDHVFMYCYDIYEGISSRDSVKYDVFTNPSANQVTDRTLDFIGAVNSVLGTDDPYAWLRNLTAAQGAAIQLGIWESKYDTSGWNLNEGDFRASGLNGEHHIKTKDTTSWWLSQFTSAIDGAASIDSKYVMFLQNAGKQDMIAGDPPANDVPEPGSLALIGLALAGLAATRRKNSA